MSSIMRARSAPTGRWEGGHRGFLSQAEGCWTFDARDRMPRLSRANAPDRPFSSRMAALAITGFFAEGRGVLLSDIHRVFAWFERQDRRSGEARAIVCLECPLSNYPWSLEIGRLRA